METEDTQGTGAETELTEEQIAEQKAAEEVAQKEAEEAERKEQEAIEDKTWFKERIGRFTRQKYELTDRAERAEQRAADLEKRIKKLEGQQEPEFQATRPRPTRAQFSEKFDNPLDADEAYFDALSDWKLEQHSAREQYKRQQEADIQKIKNEHQTFEQKRIKTVSTGKEKYQDWENVVFSIPGAIMHQNLAAAVMELPEGASVAYYLGKNLQEAERISKLSPYAMAAELGKIEVKLSHNEKKTTTAPPPLSTIKGRSQPESEIDPDKDPEGWVKARNEGRI